MSKAKQFLALILCLALCAGFGAPALAAGEVDGLSYTSEVEIKNDESKQFTVEYTFDTPQASSSGYGLQLQIPEGISLVSETKENNEDDEVTTYEAYYKYVATNGNHLSTRLADTPSVVDGITTFGATLDTYRNIEGFRIEFKLNDKAELGQTYSLVAKEIKASAGTGAGQTTAFADITTQISYVDATKALTSVELKTASFTYAVGMSAEPIIGSANLTVKDSASPAAVVESTGYSADIYANNESATPVTELHAGTYVVGATGVSPYSGTVYSDAFTITKAENTATIQPSATVVAGASYDLANLVTGRIGTVSGTITPAVEGVTVNGSIVTVGKDVEAGTEITVAVTDNGTVNGHADYESKTGTVKLTVAAGEAMYPDKALAIESKTYNGTVPTVTWPASWYTNADTKTEETEINGTAEYVYTVSASVRTAAGAYSEYATLPSTTLLENVTEVGRYRVAWSATIETDDAVYVSKGDTAYFEIKPIEIASATVTSSTSAAGYTGEAIEPDATLKVKTTGSETETELPRVNETTGAVNYNFVYYNNVSVYTVDDSAHASIGVEFNKQIYTTAEGYELTKASFKITKAAASKVVTSENTPAAVKELGYTGAAQRLVTAGKAAFGATVLYRLLPEDTTLTTSSTAANVAADYDDASGDEYKASTASLTATDAGAYKVAWFVPGTANYEQAGGVLEATIAPVAITANDLRLSAYSAVLSNESATLPTVTVTVGEKTLAKDSDYYLVWDSTQTMPTNVEESTTDTTVNAADTYYAHIVGINNYASSAESAPTKSFLVTENPVEWSYAYTVTENAVTITATPDSDHTSLGEKTATIKKANATMTWDYTGVNPITTEVTDGFPLEVSFYYEKQNDTGWNPVDNPVNVGTYRAVASIAAVNEDGEPCTGYFTFTINAITSVTIDAPGTLALDHGVAALPAVTVKATVNSASTTLKNGSDYYVVWSDAETTPVTSATTAGSSAYTATVYGLGNFAGATQTAKLTVTDARAEASVSARNNGKVELYTDGEEYGDGEAAAKAKATEGDTVYVEVTPNTKATEGGDSKDYTLSKLEVKSDGKDVPFKMVSTKDGTTTYIFTMPAAAVTVTPTFAAVVEAADPVKEAPATDANTDAVSVSNITEEIEDTVNTQIDNLKTQVATETKIDQASGATGDEVITYSQDFTETEKTALDALGLTTEETEPQMISQPVFEVSYGKIETTGAIPEGGTDVGITSVEVEVNAFIQSFVTYSDQEATQQAGESKGEALAREGKAVRLDPEPASMKGAALTLKLPVPKGMNPKAGESWLYLKHESGKMMRAPFFGGSSPYIQIDKYDWGFSRLTIVAEDTSEAVYNATSYGTFQSALNQLIADGGSAEINLNRNGADYSNKTVTPTKELTITLGLTTNIPDGMAVSDLNPSVASTDAGYAILSTVKSDNEIELAIVAVSDDTVTAMDDEGPVAGAAVTVTYTDGSLTPVTITTVTGTDGTVLIPNVPKGAEITVTTATAQGSDVYDGSNNTTVYVIGDVNAPTISSSGSTVTITPPSMTLPAGATVVIYYTDDGSDPTIASTKYTGPFTVSGTKTINAIAAVGSKTSDIATATVTGGSGGGGGGGAPANVSVDKTTNGTVTVSNTGAAAGSTVTLTVKPDEGYALDTLTVKDKDGKEIALKDNGNGTYSFTMPERSLLPVSVNATFKAASAPAAAGFEDVPAGSYYADAVAWALEKGVTRGIDETHFGPNIGCTRAQFVTFLWRAAGSPEPASTENPFADVSETAHADYYKAILWAVEQGVTLGTNSEGTEFSPSRIVTRGQAVTFMSRYNTIAKLANEEGESSFTDVADGAFYSDAVDWAVANGITNGNSTTANTFGPNDDCVRTQMITFLYRFFTGTKA